MPLVRPFGIDNGELDGLSRSHIFVLGYELAIFDESLKRPEGFEMLIHAENFDRVKSAIVKTGRQHSITWMEGDVSETWQTVKVAAAATKESEGDK